MNLSTHATPVRRQALWLIECIGWLMAVVCLATWSVWQFAGSAALHRDLELFATVRAQTDTSLWSPERIEAWRASLNQESPPPLGVLRIPRIGVEGPVLTGTDDWTLNRGIGHIAGTALPGTDDNSGLAGHRDGFFRALKDIQTGDVIQLETLSGMTVYRVERTWIVNPEDVWVLDRTNKSALTLVTCYPFYFIGSAPQRYIVRAVREPASWPSTAR